MDLFNLTDNQYKTQVFYQSGYWVKPRGISMVFITAIGAGGGGGGGTPSATNTASSGGGGGGSAAITRVVLPASVITETLRVNVGTGGSGGGSASGGGTGGASYVYLPIGNAASTALCFANGGNGGVSTGAGGTAGSAAAPTSAIYLSLGQYGNLGGGNGAAGTSGAGGDSITFGTSSLGPTTPGAAGGGKTALNAGASGGDIIGNVIIPTLSGGNSSGTNGQNGIFQMKPFFGLGGSGCGMVS